MSVYAAPSILRILREENSMFGMLNRIDPQVVWSPMHAGVPFPLLDAAGENTGVNCEVFFLSDRYPKYVKNKGLAREAAAALFFSAKSSKSATSKRVAYIPAVEKLDDELVAKIEGVDVLLLDGTFWSDDELIRIQGGGETAHQMGHIPVEESLRLLKNVKVGRRIYMHINNTNPILNEASPEHRAVRACRLGSGGGQLASGTVTENKIEQNPKLTFEELRAALRQVGEERYHHRHPFHLLMHEGKLSRGQLQAWALNRYYYQSIIPIKDAIILSRSTDSDVSSRVA